MPGTEDNPDDDDSGSFVEAMRYRIGKFRVWQVVVAAFVIGLILGLTL